MVVHQYDAIDLRYSALLFWTKKHPMYKKYCLDELHYKSKQKEHEDKFVAA